MAELTELQSRFDGGMDQDTPIHQLPSNKVFLSENMLPSLEWQGAIQMRNGWAYATPNLSTIRSATSSIAAMGSGENAQVYAVDDDGHLWRIGNTTDLGQAVTTRQAPLSFAGKLVITPSASGITMAWDNATQTLGALSGSPPAGRYQEIHKGRLVLAGGANRIWFSGGYDPTSWDTTNAYMDTSRNISGIVSVNNMLLVFSWSMIERVRGGIPPPGPGDDMVLEPVSGNVGCIDNRSIAVYGNRAIFASSSGVFDTDGVSVRNLSKEAGMSSHYHETVASFSPVLSGYVFKDKYLLSVPARNVVYVVDLISNSWYIITNMKASMFLQPIGNSNFYFGSYDTPFVANANSVFLQSEDAFQRNQDADGNRIAPHIQTSYFGTDRLGAKRWKMLQPTYEMGAASGTPTMTVSRSTTTTLSQSDEALVKIMPATSFREIRRERIPLGFSSLGASFDFQLTPGTDRINTFRLYRLDANVHARESSRGSFGVAA